MVDAGAGRGKPCACRNLSNPYAPRLPKRSSRGAECIFTRRIAIFGDVFVYFFTDVGISFISEKKEEK